MKILFQSLMRYPYLLGGVILTIPINRLMLLLSPYFLKTAIDEHIIPAQTKGLETLLIQFMLYLILLVGFNFFETLLTAHN